MTSITIPIVVFVNVETCQSTHFTISVNSSSCIKQMKNRSVKFIVPIKYHYDALDILLMPNLYL